MYHWGPCHRVLNQNSVRLGCLVIFVKKGVLPWANLSVELCDLEVIVEFSHGIRVISEHRHRIHRRPDPSWRVLVIFLVQYLYYEEVPAREHLWLSDCCCCGAVLATRSATAKTTSPDSCTLQCSRKMSQQHQIEDL